MKIMFCFFSQWRGWVQPKWWCTCICNKWQWWRFFCIGKREFLNNNTIHLLLWVLFYLFQDRKVLVKSFKSYYVKICKVRAMCTNCINCVVLCFWNEYMYLEVPTFLLQLWPVSHTKKYSHWMQTRKSILIIFFGIWLVHKKAKHVCLTESVSKVIAPIFVCNIECVKRNVLLGH